MTLSHRIRGICAISVSLLASTGRQASAQLVAQNIDATVFESRITPIYLVAQNPTTEEPKFEITTSPTAGIISSSTPPLIAGSKNIALVLYTSFLPGAKVDSFSYKAKIESTGAESVATVNIRILDAGLRWDLFTTGTTSLSEDVGAFSNANFLFRLDWLVKEPWHKEEDRAARDAVKELFAKHPMPLPPAPQKGQRPSTAADSQSANPAAATANQNPPRWQLEDNQPSNRINRALSARFTFETGVVSIPVVEEPSKRVDDSAPAAPSNGEESGSAPTQTTRNAFSFGGEAVASFVAHAGDGGSLAEFGGGGRILYRIPIREDQIVKKDGTTFITFSEDQRDAGFGVYEFFARFRLAQFEDEDNKAYDRARALATGQLHLVHPKNLDDLLVLEAGFQRNEGLRIEGTNGGNGDPGSAESWLNRWFVRFLATPEIPNSGHTKALIGVEVNNSRDDGRRNVRLFYGVNIALGSLFSRS